MNEKIKVFLIPQVVTSMSRPSCQN